MKTPLTFDRLIACFSKLPGIGRRSAERIVIKLVIKRDTLMQELIASLQEAGEKISCCSQCGSITPVDKNPCKLCTDPLRDSSVMCVVEDTADILMIENSGGYHGRYHALMAKISPMSHEGVKELHLEKLIKRLGSEPIKEVILALNSDVESEATSSYIRDRLANRKLRITRPAMGLPAGSGIAYSDAVTLERAIKGRQQF